VPSLREQEAHRRLSEARVARLATADADGRPHVVPICFALDGDSLYSAVDHKPKRGPDLRRIDNLRANPLASVLVDHYDEDWDRLWWVRADGTARILDTEDHQTREERSRAIALLAEKYDQYVGRAPRGSVISLTLRSWRSWAPR
jgi:PPOX class probable F420-dependent enzyme